MPVLKLVEFLDRHRVRYTKINHSHAFTAQEVAQASHVPGHEMAKTVMVLLDGKLAMAVLPASFNVDLDHLRELTKARKVQLATESQFQRAFPDCEVGAMPPFGNLWNIPVYAASALKNNQRIAFNAGTHRQVVQLAYEDFERLVKPHILDFATAPA
jgi:Ala-tRNA(Pro) deacylase